VAVVGLGYWGPNLLRVLGDNVDACVQWMCDLDPERLGEYRRRHPGARATTRIDRVRADPAVDAVMIATPVDTHFSLARGALEAVTAAHDAGAGFQPAHPPRGRVR
jgi:predicted dehydrogenase